MFAATGVGAVAALRQSGQSFEGLIHMLLRLPLIVEHQLDDAILANDIRLPALQKP